MRLRLEVILTKAVFRQIVGLLFMSNLLLLTGCATIGANLALDLAKEEEAKGCAASDPGDIKKVELADCERISRLIKKAGVPNGFVGYDKSGRIKLKGSYLNEEQVDKAFMVAFTAVGASSLDISPVTPRDLQEMRMVKGYTPSQLSEENGNKYALLVGVSKFKYPKSKKNPLGVTPIQTAGEDVDAIEEILEKNGFKITSLKDESATKNNILSEMSELKGKVTPSDSVVVYISTHGTPPDTFGKMGIFPYDIYPKILDTRTANVQEQANQIPKDETGDDKFLEIVRDRIDTLKTAVSFDNVQDFITSINTNKFVAILDTCYSGAALGALTYPVGGSQYAEREQSYLQSQSSENNSELLGAGKLCESSGYNNTAFSGIITQQHVRSDQKKCQSSNGSKGLSLDSDATVPAETTSSVRGVYGYEMMEKFRTVFSESNSQLQQGKVIITATSGHEESQFDSGKLPTSYFTYYLVRGLENSHGQIFPAFDYAKIRTRKIVSESLENCSQTPEMISTPDACVNIDLSK